MGIVKLDHVQDDKEFKRIIYEESLEKRRLQENMIIVKGFEGGSCRKMEKFPVSCQKTGDKLGFQLEKK